MSKFIANIRRGLLEIPLRNPSPDRIARSGDAGKAVNCYTTRIFRGQDNQLIVQSADGDNLRCLEYDGERYSITSQIDFNDVVNDKFEFTHYYGLWNITYHGWLSLALGRVFRLPYIRAWLHTRRSEIGQGLYNRRKLVTKQRTDLLKVVLDAQLNGRDKVSSLSVMSLIHTDKWYLHPNKDDQHHRVQFYLDALTQTGDLVRNGIDYQISGQGIAAIELYEEQERKHSESIGSQRRMFWLTIFIVLLTIVQAGLIKLPPLLDLSNHSMQPNNSFKPNPLRGST